MGMRRCKGDGRNMTAIYGAVHFFVDFACAYLMFSRIYEADNWYLCLLLYNFFAFAMQMPVGIFADYKNRNAGMAVWGCILVAFSYLPAAAASALAGTGALGPVWATAASVFAGLGNGLFHVGGGLDVLNKSEKSAGLLGIFVAPGALGIYFGTLFAKQSGDGTEWPVFLLLGAALCIFWCARKSGIWHQSGNRPFSVFPEKHLLTKAKKQAAASAVACLFAVVVLRSYLGMIQDFTWKDSIDAGMILAAAAALGKAAGGFLTDIAGVKKTAAVSVVTAGVLYLFSSHPAAGILAVFFWNMTMPITLWAVARILPGAKGFSFGLLTFALFLGFCPSYLGSLAFTELFGRPEIGLGILCGVSLVLLRGGSYYAGKYLH